MEVDSDIETHPCAAEIDQITCYEEKKLLIQSAEERCDNLKNQLDYLRSLLSYYNYYDGPDNEINAEDVSTSEERELNVCVSSELRWKDGENQPHSKYQSSSPTMMPMERCDVLEDEYLDDCALSEFVTQGVSENYTCNGAEPSYLSNDMLEGMNGDDELRQLKQPSIPKLNIPKCDSSEFLSFMPMTIESTAYITDTEMFEKPINDTVITNFKEKNGITQGSRIIPTYVENNHNVNFISHKNFNLGKSHDKFLNGTHKYTGPKLKGREGAGIKECEILEKSTLSKRRERKLMSGTAAKENVQALSVRQSKESKNNVKPNSSPAKTDHKIIRNSKGGCQRNYRSPLLISTSVISVATIPASNFKKENEQFFGTTNVKISKRTCVHDEKSNKSKSENTKKTVIPPQLKKKTYGQKAHGDNLMSNLFHVSKTGYKFLENFNDNECKKLAPVRMVKGLTRKRSVTTNSLPNHKIAMQSTAVWAETTNGSEGRLGQNAKTYSHALKPISVSLVKKELISSYVIKKTKEKNKLLGSENKEQEKNKSKIFRKGFGLHTISSKLKMSEKLEDQRLRSKYPFVVGKATTRSHNLVLNIQQTLSIIKMKPSATHSQSVTSGTTECQEFPSVITTDGMIRSTLGMDPVMFVQTHSSISGIQNCPLINQNSITTCVIPSDIIETQDWYLFQEKYGDASVNKCQCYPRNCTSYYKVINQYLSSEDDIQFFHENEGLQSCGLPKMFRQMALTKGETTRMRLSQILHQVQTFQGMLNGKQRK